MKIVLYVVSILFAVYGVLHIKDVYNWFKNLKRRK